MKLYNIDQYKLTSYRVCADNIDKKILINVFKIFQKYSNQDILLSSFHFLNNIK